MKHLRRISLALGAVFFLYSCAIQVPPGGGDKDTEAPKIEKMTPENYSTGFSGHDLSIRFNEFIQLKDLQSQLVVSPPLQTAPETKLRKRTLYIHFDDTLRPNSTYTFNFGNAIADNNEANALENFNYVFSTGEVIDSLEISGQVDFAFDHKTEKGILVMLYANQNDSVPYKERPLYFGKTNELGQFRISNISPGAYKIFALKTAGTDLQYTSADQSIAYPDSTVMAGSSGLHLHMFNEQPSFQVLKSFSESPGKVVVIATGALDTLPFAWISDTAKLGLRAMNFSPKKDTLSIYYTNLLSDSMQFTLRSNAKTDTVTLRLFRFEGKQNLKRLFVLSAEPSAGLTQPQDLHLPFVLKFNHPIQVTDTEKIQFMSDSLPVKPFHLSFLDSMHTALAFSTSWKEARTYHVMIPSGAVEDMYGLKNDTILADFRTRELTDYGTVAVHVHQKSPASSGILQLLDAKEVVVRESQVNSDSLVQFLNVLPGTYRMKLILDENRNGKWDTGNYLRKVQPETVIYYPEAIMVRANWDVDLKWEY